MKHLVVITDWKDEFPAVVAAECHAKWGAIYLGVAETESDAIVWVFADRLITDAEATKIFKA